MQLYHFSEDPDIEVFHPHVASTSKIRDRAFVWAIGEWHSPMYLVPRDCPRACFWAGSNTSFEDQEKWLHGLDPRFVMVVEANWVDRIRKARIYRYTMPNTSFEVHDLAAGHYVSAESVYPLKVEVVDDPIGEIVKAGVELRIAPRLGPMWKLVWSTSTLEYSGTRLRNAIGHPEEFE